MQSAEIGSSVHTLLQGLSMPLMSRHGNMVGQDKDVGAEGNRPWHALLRVGRAAFRRCGNPGLMGGSQPSARSGAEWVIYNLT
jgi:hypothetical protein